MKDHELAKLHNELRDTAKKYADTEQLRERLISVIKPLELELRFLEAKITDLEAR